MAGQGLLSGEASFLAVIWQMKREAVEVGRVLHT